MIAQRLDDTHALIEYVQPRLDVETYNKISAEAKSQKTSKTALARNAIREYIKNTKP
jgi:predicted transcriptional regulator